MENNDLRKDINPNGLILLWAFAESGIGGILHALKLPFTGIFVGGIAIICIALLSYFTNNRLTILKALGVVLLVKFTVSPHSPWQAYVAVVFQAYLGYFLFKTNYHFKIKCFLLSVICMLESAVQRILIMMLIYGTNFMKAIDKAALALAQSLGLNDLPSLVISVFGLYVVVHIAVGIAIGWWLPTIPERLWLPELKVPDSPNLSPHVVRKKGFLAILSGFIILAVILFIIKLLVPEMPASSIFFIFVRSLFVSFGLIFIVGPIIKSFILKYSADKTLQNQALFKEIVNDIPDFTSRAISLINFVNREYSGFQKFKIYILGLLQLSLRYKK